jgi:hypothetical protein
VDGTKITGGDQTGLNFYDGSSANYFEAWGPCMAQPWFQLNTIGGAGGTIYVDDFSLDTTWNSTQYSKGE